MFTQKICFFHIMFLVIVSTGCANHSKKTAANKSLTKFENTNQLQLASPLSKDQEIIQELTGKPVSQIPTQEQLKNKPVSTQHYYAGLRSYEAKNYIKAIKHFNTVLKKYPQSPEVKLAFSAKAKIYTEMGLSEPAQLNLKMARSAPQIKKTNRLSKNKSDSTGTPQIKR